MPRTDQSGHTLAELIIVIGVTSLMFTSVILTMTGTLDAMEHITRRGEIDHSGLYAVRRLSMDAASAIELTTTEPDNLAFIVPDITGDGVDDEISYTVTDSTLERTVDGTAMSIAEDVSACTFEYVYTDEESPAVVPESEVQELIAGRFTGFPEEAGTVYDPRPTFDLGFGDIFHQQFFAEASADRPSAVLLRLKARSPAEPLLVKLFDTEDWELLAKGSIGNLPVDDVVREYAVPLSWVAPDTRGIREGNKYAIRVSSISMTNYGGSIEFDRIDQWAGGVTGWDNHAFLFFSYNFGFSWHNYGDSADMVFELRGLKRRHHGRADETAETLPRAVDITLVTRRGQAVSRQNTRIRLLNF